MPATGARLLFVSPSAYPMGGVATWLNYVLPGLERKGFKCTLALASGRHHHPRDYLARNPWADVALFENATGSPFGRIRAVAGAMAKCKPDLVVSVNMAPLADAIDRQRCRGQVLPRLVMALHGLQADLLADVALTAGVLDAVITPNKLCAQLAAGQIGDPSRAFYAPCGVSAVPDIHQNPLSKPAHETLRLLFVGRLEQQQKQVLDLVHIMVRARSRQHHCTLTVAGSGPDERLLVDAIQREKLSAEVRLVGELTTAQVREEYRRHDALLLTSSWETGPIVIWEAMAHGLAVLTSTYVGSGLEGALVHDRNCLMFSVGDIEAAAAQLGRLAQPELRARLTTNAAATVKLRYSVEASVDAWATAFEQVLRLPHLVPPKKMPTLPAAGRLDRLLGAVWADRARRAAGVEFAHQDPGSEWPHTRCAGADEAAFLADAAIVDRGEEARRLSRCVAETPYLPAVTRTVVT